jgi:DnaA family protein
MEPLSGAVQLPLGVRLRDEATLDNFCFAFSPAPLLPLLEQQAGNDGEPLIYLSGPPGCGRSHLLQAACHLRGAGGALYLPLEQLLGMPADDVLAGTEYMGLICLDDLDKVIADPAWERALFNLCNRVRETGARLLISANEAPRNLRVQLPDLQSRLSWGVVLQLPEPDDEAKLAILGFRAARRGLQLSGEPARFILARSDRSMSGLMAVLDRLDQESLVHQRQLSIPFIKQCMGW